MYKRNHAEGRLLKNNSVVAIWHRLLSGGVNAFSDVKNAVQLDMC